MYIRDRLYLLLGKKITDEFIDATTLMVNTLRISRIYIVGSFARGKDESTSDLDLVIISSDFSNFGSLTRVKMVKTLMKEIELKIDVFCLTQIEFDSIEKEAPSLYYKPRFEVWINEKYAS